MMVYCLYFPNSARRDPPSGRIASEAQVQPHFEARSRTVALHLDGLTRLGDLLLEDQRPAQQVGELHLDLGPTVDAVAGRKVERMDRKLLDVAQPRDADGMDARSLQVVEQRQVELPHLVEAGRPGDVGIDQVGRSPLQCALLVRVGSAVGQCHVRVHVSSVGPDAQRLGQRLAHLDLDTGRHAVVGIAEGVDRGAAREHLHALDRLVEEFVVSRYRDHVTAAVEQLVAQIDVVVVAVHQLLVTAQLHRTVGLLVEERGHLDERRPRDGPREGKPQLLPLTERIAEVERREEVALVEVAALTDALVVGIIDPLLRHLETQTGVDEQPLGRLEVHRCIYRSDRVARIVAVLGLLLAVDDQRAVGHVGEIQVAVRVVDVVDLR